VLLGRRKSNDNAGLNLLDPPHGSGAGHDDRRLT
jgi:hypothetical protein